MTREIENLWIPLKDGRKIAARVWLPDESALPAPAIFEWLPYRKRDGTADRDDIAYPRFAARGYAGVRADTPGNGESDGLMADEYTPDEIASGREALEWIAAQPWCSGAVGMIGISWGGFNGLQIGMTRPPSLKAVVSVASAVDRYADDIHAKGGCPLTDNLAWSAQMLAYSSRPPDPSLVGGRWRDMWRQRLENMPFLAANWLRHPRRDYFWKHGSLCEDWGALTAPTLAIGGWADLYVNTPPQIAENLSASGRALMGPWEHKYPHLAKVGPSGDFEGEVVRWFDRWLKGEKNDAESLPALRAFVSEYSPPSEKYGPAKGHWVAEKRWPSPNVSGLVLHLGAGDLRESPGAGTAEISPSAVVGADGGALCAGMRIDGELPGDQRNDDALSLCFDGAPLESPLEILGAPKLEIAFSVDRPVAFVVARLCEVAPDGASARVSFGALNLAMRDSAETPSPLIPGEKYRAAVLLDHCARKFSPGHRVRLALSANYWPMMWPAPNPAATRLDLAECRLILPQRKATGGEIEMPPPPPFSAPAREVLSPPQHRRARGTTPDGRIFREEYDNFGKIRNPSHGLETASEVSQRAEIHPGDLSSATLRAEWKMSLARGEWNVRTESGHEMRTDAGHFHLRAWLRAFEDGRLFAEREWDESVPRDLM